MLAIQTCRFLIGTKVPFSDFPQILRTYLAGQNLHYNRFLYYFQDDFGALPKIIRDCPQIGPIRVRQNGSQEQHFLSNIPDGGCTEEDILPLVPKLHRRYGCGEVHLMFCDMDFFGQAIAGILKSPGNTPDCIKSPGITLHRDSVFPRWSSIDLRIVIYDGRYVFDPTPYIQAMQDLFPGIRTMGFIECCMTDAEEQAYSILNRDAALLLEQARSFFRNLLPEEPRHPNFDLHPQKLSAAPVLKRLGRQYGYTYAKCEYHTFSLYKPTQNGHYILLEIDMGRNFDEINTVIEFVGMGFRHRLAQCACLPQGQSELEDNLSRVFQALTDAEQEVIPPLAAHYPPTPDWFVPIA